MMLNELTSRRERRKTTNNRLGYWMLKRKMSTDALTRRLVDGNATALGLMEQGKALPTRTDLEAITDALDVNAIEIWTREQLDLLKLLKGEKEVKDWHEGQVRFKVWMLPEEKAMLEDAIKKLGYETPTAWFRQMAAITLAKTERG